MIKTKAFDIRSISLLILFSSIFFAFAVIGFFCDDIVLKSVFIITGLAIVFISILLQIFIFKKNNLTVCFDCNGIKILDLNFEIQWECIRGFYYKNLWFICLPNELEIFVKKDDVTDLFSDLYRVFVYISKRKYKKILKLIPPKCLNENEFLIYENIDLKHKDKYRMY